MAYTITEAQAAKLLYFAEAIVGKQIQNGMISLNDRDDYVQELVLIMVKHQDEWNVPEGVDLEVYAYTVMEKRFWNIWHKNNSVKDVMNETVSLYNTFVNENGEEEEFISRLTEYGMMCDFSGIRDFIVQSNLHSEIHSFLLTLPSDERELCEILMWCDNISEISRILNKHRQTIQRMIERIRNKMVTAGISQENQKNQKKVQKGCDKFAFKK